MSEQDKRAMMTLADTIKGEINRMCVTDELSELDTMAFYATKNIEELKYRRYMVDFKAEGENR